MSIVSRNEKRLQKHVTDCEEMVRNSTVQTIQGQLKRLEAINNMRNNPLLDDVENRIVAVEKQISTLEHQLELSSLQHDKMRRLETLQWIKNYSLPNNAPNSALNRTSAF